MSALMWAGLPLIAFFVWAARKRPFAKDEPGPSLSEPDDWVEWASCLRQHALPTLTITLKNKRPILYSQSKLGGLPYWPSGMSYPRDKHGIPLAFLAQLNCSDTSLPDDGFPDTGLLQFFIKNDASYGLAPGDDRGHADALSDSVKNYAVIYHPEVHPLYAPAIPDDVMDAVEDCLPYQGETALQLEPGDSYPEQTDFRFAEVLRQVGELPGHIVEYLHERTSDMSAHCAGGYARFPRDNDPRQQVPEHENWRLLFQLGTDSNRHLDVMWRGIGIAHFLIREEDLKKRDFSKAWFI